MDERSDESLVAEARTGSREAYGALTARCFKNVFLVCLGTLGNVHDAEDVAQEAMIRGFERITTLRDGSQFGGWVAVIARNLCINLVRRRKIAQKAAESMAVGGQERTTDTGPLERAIELLPTEIRLPLVLYYFDGRSVPAVAEKLNISNSSVYARLRTALAELHRLLVEQGDRL